MTIRSLIALLYTKVRGRELPPEVPPRVLLAFSVLHFTRLVRGSLLGWRYARPARMHFRARNVKIRNSQLLTLGHNVAFDEGVRMDAYGRVGIVIGDRVTVAEGALLAVTGVLAEPGEYIRIGHHSAIGRNNVIWGQGGVKIGNDCLLGPNCVLVSENHAFSDTTSLIRAQGHTRAPILIGDDCWLGANVVVGPGVTIGSGSVIGAGSVVVTDVPPFQVAVGSPARVVRSRMDT